MIKILIVIVIIIIIIIKIIIVMIIIQMIIVIIIIIIVITLKGAIQDFYNLLTAPQTVASMYAQVTRAQLCANHVQYIDHLSCAACHAPLCANGQLSY